MSPAISARTSCAAARWMLLDRDGTEVIRPQSGERSDVQWLWNWCTAAGRRWYASKHSRANEKTRSPFLG
jgi:hypothetical protein